jgi:hypothetical protein
LVIGQQSTVNSLLLEFRLVPGATTKK